MADQYNFSVIQKVQLNDLLQDEYLAMWSQVIYGTSGNSDIVSVAKSQIGNIGGEPYWSWYGFNSRVDIWLVLFCCLKARKEGLNE